MDGEMTQDRIRDADQLYVDGRLEAALEAYQSLVEADPGQAWAHSRIGALLAQRGDLDAAERALNRAIELNPRLAQAHSNLGNVLYARGEYTQALAKYKQATELAPENALFYQNLHAVYKKMGRVQEAVVALKHSHRLERAHARDVASQNFSRMRKRSGCLTTAVLMLILAAISATMLN